MRKTLILLMVVSLVCMGLTGVSAAEKVKVLRGHHLKVNQLPDGTNIDTTIIAQKMEEHTGLEIEQTVLPKNDARQKIVLTLASGDVPDVITMGSKSDFFKFAKQGLFEPVNDLIEDYCPVYKEKIEKRLREAPSLDGNIYAFVAERYYYIVNSIFARKDILDELNLEVPKTPEEYYQVLKTIKQETELIPITFDASEAGHFLGGSAAIAGAFGVENITMEKDGKLVFSYIQPEYKEFLTYMKKLYDEGLLDQEFAVNKSGAARDKFASGMVAMANMAWWDAKGSDQSLLKSQPDANNIYIQPPEGPDGHYGVRALNPIMQYYVIPRGARNKAGGAKFVNYLYTDKRMNLITHGVEGIHYEMKNDEIVYTDAYQEFKNWSAVYNIGNSSRESFMFRLKDKGFYPYFSQIEEFDPTTTEATHLAPPIPAFDDNLTLLEEFVYENAVKFIMGARSLDEFDQYVKEFNNKGGKKAIDAINEWYTNK